MGTRAQVIILGRVGNIRVFDNAEQDGKVNKTVTFGLAVDQWRKAEEGQPQRPPVWFNFRAINKMANMLAEYLEKGRLVQVTGVDPTPREYDRPQKVKAAINGVDHVLTVPTKETAVDYLVQSFTFVDLPKTATGPSVSVELVNDAPDTIPFIETAPEGGAETVANTDAADPAGCGAELNPENIPF